MPVRVLGRCKSGYANDVADAIVWASGGRIDRLSDAADAAQIIAMPFSGRGPCPSYLQSAVTEALGRGVVLLAAAGNSAADSADFFPANCVGVVAVAASTRQGELAAYSNMGTNVALAAPGGDAQNPILTLSTDDSASALILAAGVGTSFSVSFVAGVVGLGLSMPDRDIAALMQQQCDVATCVLDARVLLPPDATEAAASNTTNEWVYGQAMCDAGMCLASNLGWPSTQHNTPTAGTTWTVISTPGLFAYSPVIFIGDTVALITVWQSATSVTVRVAPGLGTNQAVTLSAANTVVDVAAGVFSYDSDRVSVLNVANSPSSGTPAAILATVCGVNFGKADYTDRTRFGSTAPVMTVWRSDTGVVCKTAYGLSHSFPMVVTAGVIKGTCTSAVSYDLTFTKTSTNTQGDIPSSITATGVGFGRARFTDRGRFGGSASQATEWISDTAARTKPEVGLRLYSLYYTMTTGASIVATVTQAITFDRPWVSSPSIPNAATTGGSPFKLWGQNYGAQNAYTNGIRIGDTSARAATGWISTSNLICKTAAAAGASRRIVLSIAPGGKGTLSGAFSFDTPVMSLATTRATGGVCAAAGGTCYCIGVVSLVTSNNDMYQTMVDSTSSVPCTGTGVLTCYCFMNAGRALVLSGVNFGTAETSAVVTINMATTGTVAKWVSQTSLLCPTSACTTWSVASGYSMGPIRVRFPTQSSNTNPTYALTLVTGGTICNAGYAGSGSCTACLAGRFAYAGQTVCTSCTLGQYCPPASPINLPCAAGFYCPNTTTQITCSQVIYHCPLASEYYYCPTGFSESTVCEPETYYECFDSGWYCPAGSTAPTLCRVGHYCPDPTMQIPCDSGYWCPGAGITEQGPLCAAGSYCSDPTAPQYYCDSGYYCPAGTTEPTLCSAGYYCADPTTQTPCDSGYYCPSSGLTEQTPCAAGFYCESTSSQVACSQGSYCPAQSTADTPCAAGFYCPDISTQTACASGNYCPAGTEQEAPCVAGNYCPDPSQRIPCYRGYYCPLTGLTEQSWCAAGSYCPNPTTQIACDIGYFCPEGHESQLLCDAGYYCPDTTTMLPCEAGFASPAGASVCYVECVAGMFVDGQGQCDTCSAGSYCPRGTGAEAPCRAGYFCPDTSTMLPCKARCTSAAGATICHAVYECVAGLFYNDQLTCAACSTGSYCPIGSAEDAPCAAGFYCSVPSTQTACAPGTFSYAGATACTPCPAGTNTTAVGTSSKTLACTRDFSSSPTALDVDMISYPADAPAGGDAASLFSYVPGTPEYDATNSLSWSASSPPIASIVLNLQSPVTLGKIYIAAASDSMLLDGSSFSSYSYSGHYTFSKVEVSATGNFSGEQQVVYFCNTRWCEFEQTVTFTPFLAQYVRWTQGCDASPDFNYAIYLVGLRVYEATQTCTPAMPCALCPAGTFSGAGEASCRACSPGNFSSAGATACTPCPAGTSSSAIGVSSTLACTMGVSSSPMPLDVGMFSYPSYPPAGGYAATLLYPPNEGYAATLISYVPGTADYSVDNSPSWSDPDLTATPVASIVLSLPSPVMLGQIYIAAASGSMLRQGYTMTENGYSGYYIFSKVEVSGTGDFSGEQQVVYHCTTGACESEQTITFTPFLAQYVRWIQGCDANTVAGFYERPGWTFVIPLVGLRVYAATQTCTTTMPCATCPAGSSSGTGASSCTPGSTSCPANTFTNGQSCTPCPGPSVSAPGSTTYLACACPPGTMGNVTSSTSATCAPCPVGSFCRGVACACV